jgi:hypothetical protein
MRRWLSLLCTLSMASTSTASLLRSAISVTTDDEATSSSTHRSAGYLTKPVRLDEWIDAVRSRYAFITQLDADERRWVDCKERDLYEVEKALASFRAYDATVQKAV